MDDAKKPPRFGGKLRVHLWRPDKHFLIRNPETGKPVKRVVVYDGLESRPMRAITVKKGGFYPDMRRFSRLAK